MSARYTIPAPKITTAAVRNPGVPVELEPGGMSGGGRSVYTGMAWINHSRQGLMFINNPSQRLSPRLRVVYKSLSTVVYLLYSLLCMIQGWTQFLTWNPMVGLRNYDQ